MGLGRAVLAVTAVLLLGGPAAADDLIYRNSAVTCRAKSPRIASMKVDGIRFAYSFAHAWGLAKVRLVTTGGGEEDYLVTGTANLIPRALPRNHVQPSFTFKDIECRVNHRSIVSVERCSGSLTSRQCDLSLAVGQRSYAYTVSLTVKPAH